MKKKVCFFTVADDNNLEYANKMLNSLRKFHPDVPHHLEGQKELDKNGDPQKFYRTYSQVGERLSKEYELVINIDADSIVTGDLNHIIDDENYEIGGVLNNNKTDKPLMVWNVVPEYYINCGLVAARSERFWKWWNKLNFSAWFFSTYQYREQDMLNIIFYYGDFKTKIFDMGNKWHGLISKGAWHKFIVRDGQIILPKTEGVCKEDKIIKVIHYAGGNVKKMNFNVGFKPEIVTRLEELIS